MTLRATPNELLEGYPTVTIDEAIAILAVSRSKIHELLDRDDVDTVRVGRRTMIPTTYVKELLDGTD